MTRVKMLELDLSASRHLGHTSRQFESKGQRVAYADLLIAAIALARDATLVTGNGRYYERVAELSIEDWMRP